MKKSVNSSENQSVEKLRDSLKTQQKEWIYNSEAEKNDEFAHIFFEGTHNGKTVIFDTTICTLYLYYSSLVFEIADEQLVNMIPDYEGWDSLDEENEELDEQRAELMAEIEADDSLKVQELVELVDEEEDIVIMDVYLNEPTITPDVINRFVSSYKAGNLKLDNTLYSFSLEEDI